MLCPSTVASQCCWRGVGGGASIGRQFVRQRHGPLLSLVLVRRRRHDDAAASKPQIRLCKRASELDLCSRREADAYILQGRLRVRGQVVPPVLGQLVDAQETDICISNDEDNDVEEASILLHKPVGYVSGQPDDGHDGLERHVPAVRLLTPTNLHLQREEYNSEQDYQDARDLVLSKLCFRRHYHQRQGKRRNTENSESTKEEDDNDDDDNVTLQGVVPAGRLDRDSSGLLIFTSSGVLAKKLVGANSPVEKEYVVHVEPAQSLTRHERQAGLRRLPSPQFHFGKLKKSLRLWQDPRPLQPVVEAEWLEPYEVLRLVLTEGRKRQVRRMCRELLGWHVLQLTRTRVGDIHLGDLPEGKWRPLRSEEAQSILEHTPINHTS